MNREEIRWQQRLANYNRALYQLESAVFLSIARQGAMDSRGKPYPPCTASLRPRASPWDYFFLYLTKAQSHQPDLLGHIDRVGKLLYQSEKDVEKQ